MRVVVFPLRWISYLPLLCGQIIGLAVSCHRLPADVTLNKLFEAVKTLSEQVLQVPSPWL